MTETTPSPLNNVITIDQKRVVEREVSEAVKREFRSRP
jgi:hypothetical protein